MKKIILTILVFTTSFLIFNATVFGQAGNLDVTFGTGGKVTTAILTGMDEGNAVAIQADGKIVVVGTAVNTASHNDFVLVRYNNNGTLDNTFGTAGKVNTAYNSNSESHFNAVVIQPNGKIVAAGYYLDNTNSHYYFAVLRYNTNGTLDNSFGTGGKVSTAISNGNDAEAASVALQDDGKIIVAGKAYNLNNDDIAIARYDSTGVLDNTFGTGGKVVTPIVGNSDDIGNAVAIQPDGKIVVGGICYFNSLNHFLLIRYNMNGTLDPTFHTTGIAIDSIGTFDNTGHSVAIQTDGKILLAGATANNVNAFNFAVLRYKPDGTLDTSFNTTGYAVTDFANGFDEGSAVLIQTDGKIIAGGYSYNNSSFNNYFALARYNANGTIDNTFGTAGKVTTAFNANGGDFINGMALQADTKIVAAGFTDNGSNDDFAVARYMSGINLGMADFTAASATPFIYPNPIKNEATIQYTLTKNEIISATLYDVNGRLIKRFFTNEKQNSGEHKQLLVFGDEIIPGNYVVTLSNDKQQISIKIVVQ